MEGKGGGKNGSERRRKEGKEEREKEGRKQEYVKINITACSHSCVLPLLITRYTVSNKMSLL